MGLGLGLGLASEVTRCSVRLSERKSTEPSPSGSKICHNAPISSAMPGTP